MKSVHLVKFNPVVHMYAWVWHALPPWLWHSRKKISAHVLQCLCRGSHEIAL